jgi:hypothetical protein
MNNLTDLLEQRRLGRRIPRIKFEGAMENKFNHQVRCLFFELFFLSNPLYQSSPYDYPLQADLVLSTIAIAISHDGSEPPPLLYFLSLASCIGQ